MLLRTFGKSFNSNLYKAKIIVKYNIIAFNQISNMYLTILLRLV